ncbi:hypothetical protein [Piscinibacter sp.]|jgi:hypothetical protein|uniref:hypothetical protein n=1 Tax=Piscinibacter sp. TaxID=1903157 RepID=UPI003559F51E
MQHSPHSEVHARRSAIHAHQIAPPVEIPNGYVGPVWLSTTGRMIWWTGRVAIGLRHWPERRVESNAQSACWVQALMLS